MSDLNSARDTLRYLLGEQMALSDVGVKTVMVICEEAQVPIDTFCYWRLTENTPGRLYDNIVKSDKVLTEFLTWTTEQYDTAKVTVFLEIDTFFAAERASRDNPLRLFQKPVRDVSPLIQYLMGHHFMVPHEVEWRKAEALSQLRIKPWYKYYLGDLYKYIPKKKEEQDGNR